MTEAKSPMRQIRRARALSLDEVAAETGIDRGRLSRYERGFSKPLAPAREALAEFFGFPDFVLFPPAEGQERRV